MKSIKALFGLFLMLLVDILQLWLSTSVLLSWVMRSKYFFPIPYLPIKPASLLASAAGSTNVESTPFANYGLNLGPMVISAIFRFANGRIEGFMGKALSNAYKKQKKEKKAARKEEEKLEAERLRRERKAARKARREERELRKEQHREQYEAQEEKAKSSQESAMDVVVGDDDDDNVDVVVVEGTNSSNGTCDITQQDTTTTIGGMEDLD